MLTVGDRCQMDPWWRLLRSVKAALYGAPWDIRLFYRADFEDGLLVHGVSTSKQVRTTFLIIQNLAILKWFATCRMPKWRII